MTRSEDILVPHAVGGLHNHKLCFHFIPTIESNIYEDQQTQFWFTFNVYDTSIRYFKFNFNH